MKDNVVSFPERFDAKTPAGLLRCTQEYLKGNETARVMILILEESKEGVGVLSVGHTTMSPQDKFFMLEFAKHTTTNEIFCATD